MNKFKGKFEAKEDEHMMVCKVGNYKKGQL